MFNTVTTVIINIFWTQSCNQNTRMMYQPGIKYLFPIHGCELGLVTLHLEMMTFFLDSGVIQPTLNSTEVFNSVLKVDRSLNL